MPQKIIIITANLQLSGELMRAFLAAGISSATLTSPARLQPQDKELYSLALLDFDSLGVGKHSEFKAFIARVPGLPVIAMCDMARTSNQDTVEILGAGANDVVPKKIDPKLLIAKSRAHLRRGADNDRAAGGWLNR